MTVEMMNIVVLMLCMLAIIAMLLIWKDDNIRWVRIFAVVVLFTGAIACIVKSAIFDGGIIFYGIALIWLSTGVYTLYSYNILKGGDEKQEELSGN